MPITNYTIARLLETVIVNQEIIMSGLDDLKAAVAKETSVEAGAVIALQGLADKVRNAGNDADLEALANEITASVQPLANAIAANTTAAPTTGATGASGASGPAPDAGATGASGPAPNAGATGASGATS